ncbi:hypothetical protein TRICI_002988 [Trichomonascus ciferrii]|uniref:Phosphotyrosine protein phosphatase I domain-containing protein n=1 Tax=Trichomonascus ciferrii TaxID=44093 RepID=A0A642V487_9ASCO|nr:hypothetical protein TRICI_002988 [Trichomonascus ciferrii]
MDHFEKIDSFGTGAYHAGDPPDSRSARECRKNGVAVDHRAQKIRREHFSEFDYIIAMDEENLEDLEDMAPKNCRAKVHLFGEFRTDKAYKKIISDPYYGGPKGFETNFKQITHFSQNFIDHIVKNHE